MADWRRRIREPRIWVLVLLSLGAFIVVLWFSGSLIPLFGALVVSYLLDPLVAGLERRRVPRLLAIVLVMLGSLVLISLILFAIIPTMVEQINALANEVPDLITEVEQWVAGVQNRMPEAFSGAPLQRFLERFSVTLESLLGNLITVLLAWAGGTIGGVIYSILIAFMVFFLLKDKAEILTYLQRTFPFLKDRSVREVLADIDRPMCMFIKGKFIVVFLLFLLSTLVFWAIRLDFFLLLGILTGFSTIVPWVGAFVVGVLVVAAGLLQWGIGGAIWTLFVYLAVQTVDANLMTPVIIGRETRIHPIGIIVAILICGSIWGFWGVVFAVPAAVVVKSILDVLYFPSLARAAAPAGGEGEAGPVSGEDQA